MNVQRVAAVASTAAVIAAVVTGFVLSGAPEEQRLKRLDDRRVADLQQLARAVNGYGVERGALPNELDSVLDGRHLSRMPSDPVTGLPYRYERRSALAYRLCAEFARPSDTSPDAEDFWAHPRGEGCFDFTVTRNPAARR